MIRERFLGIANDYRGGHAGLFLKSNLDYKLISVYSLSTLYFVMFCKRYD